MGSSCALLLLHAETALSRRHEVGKVRSPLQLPWGGGFLLTSFLGMSANRAESEGGGAPRQRLRKGDFSFQFYGVAQLDQAMLRLSV
jgi:hypothetical protein